MSSRPAAFVRILSLVCVAAFTSACHPTAIPGYFTVVPPRTADQAGDFRTDDPSSATDDNGGAGNGTGTGTGSGTPNSELCVLHPEAAACSKTPVVTTPGVVTILFTMSQIPQGAASLILGNAIKYASPVENPKILFVKDSETGGEDEGDPDYIKNTLLLGYTLDYGVIPAGGLSADAVAGKDLVIVSNPGHPLSDLLTRETLLNFKGGVILLGDDMTRGTGFDNDALSGLKNISNGATMTCGGETYKYDNLEGYRYQITINEEFLPGIPAEFKHYEYGNDLDHTMIVGAGVQVLAWGAAAEGTCDIGNVPAIVRYPRP